MQLHNEDPGIFYRTRKLQINMISDNRLLKEANKHVSEWIKYYDKNSLRTKPNNKQIPIQDDTGLYTTKT